jgi:hypothetical protein
MMRNGFLKLLTITIVMLGMSSVVGAFPYERTAELVQVDNAQDAIGRAFDNLWRSFQSSGDYQQTLIEVRSSRSEFEQARMSALASWQQSTEYKSAQLRIWKLQQQLEANRNSPQQVAQLADELLDARCALSATESRLLSSDERTKTARYVMLDAQAKAASLRENFVRSIQADPQWRAARRQLEAAVRVASMSR